MSERRSGAGPEGAGRGRPARVQLPLLDRLMDAEPAEASERPLSLTGAMDIVRASIRSDLEELLNSRRRWRSWDVHLAELDRSLVGYGLPDFAAGAFNDPRRREELRQLIEGCIRRFEPRVTNLRVTLVETTDKVSSSIRLRIEALLRAEPAPEPIAFDTLVDVVTKDVTVLSKEA